MSPNPANQFIELNFSDEDHLDYSIYSVQGKLIFGGSILNGQKINIDHLSTGHYFIQVKNKQGIYTERFIKQD